MKATEAAAAARYMSFIVRTPIDGANPPPSSIVLTLYGSGGRWFPPKPQFCLLLGGRRGRRSVGRGSRRRGRGRLDGALPRDQHVVDHVQQSAAGLQVGLDDGGAVHLQRAGLVAAVEQDGVARARRDRTL